MRRVSRLKRWVHRGVLVARCREGEEALVHAAVENVEVTKWDVHREDGEAIQRIAFTSARKFFQQGVVWERKARIGVMASHESHVLEAVLKQYEVPVVISNHEHLRGLTESYGVAFEFVAPENEDVEIRLFKDVDVIVLAKYMRILSPKFCEIQCRNLNFDPPTVCVGVPS